MRYLQLPAPDYTVCLNRATIDNNDGLLRDFFIPNAVGYYLKVQDEDLRRVSKVEYNGIDLIAKNPFRKLPYSVTPIFNLGHLESRVIEEAAPQHTDLTSGYVNHIGTFTTTAVREDQAVHLTRVNYEVHSCHNGIRKVYHVTDTYVEGEINPPICEFVSKMI